MKYPVFRLHLYETRLLDFLQEHLGLETIYTVKYEEKSTQTDKQVFWSYFT